MGKFLSTILGLIIAGIAFGFLWFFIPLVSSLLNASPLYLSYFICGFIVLVSFFGIMAFKSKYMKIMPVILAIILGLITANVMHRRYGRESYKHGVLISYRGVYNKFGSEIIPSQSSPMHIRYTTDGTPVIVSMYFQGGYHYNIYTLEGVCIARGADSLDGIM